MSTPLRFGPFFLDTRIAVGGTAEVYLARPAEPTPSLPARLIVKRLLPHFATDQEGRTMFDREARLHAAVTHENVVTVFHAGVDATGEPYLAMEYIDGVDGYRLLRRLRQDNQSLPVGVAVHVAREVLRALESVHGARDAKGTPLGIVHRDVSPSNIYLSIDGRVKLGDFGIARSTTRLTLRSESGQVLKGKFAYLAPEQVAGEDADHRADLFSLATVFAEILLGKPLFPGGGQLAVLLAIRDCRIDALLEMEDRLPAGLLDVLQKALARDPQDRYANAHDFFEALAPFAADPQIAARELAARVKWVQSATSSDSIAAVRTSVAAMRAVRPQSIEPDPAPDSQVTTGQYTLLPSFVETRDGETLGPWTFARVMEALVTGAVTRGDKIDFMGRGMKAIEQIEELARFLPASTATTNQLSGPGAPDFRDDLAATAMLDVLMRILANKESGVLFAERGADETGLTSRKELYFQGGKLHHVASSSASELLGEYLVRRGKLAREELDMALAVLPRYGGKIGDTLIGLGLVGPVDIFRAIREQGRDRVADLFTWKQGKVSYYRGQAAPRVEFALDLDLPALMLAGLEAAKPTDTPVDEYRARLDEMIGPAPSNSGDAFFWLAAVVWPPLVARVLGLAKPARNLREVLKASARAGLSAGDVLRAIEVLVAARLLAWQ